MDTMYQYGVFTSVSLALVILSSTPFIPEPIPSSATVGPRGHSLAQDKSSSVLLANHRATISVHAILPDARQGQIQVLAATQVAMCMMRLLIRSAFLVAAIRSKFMRSLDALGWREDGATNCRA